MAEARRLQDFIGGGCVVAPTTITDPFLDVVDPTTTGVIAREIVSAAADGSRPGTPGDGYFYAPTVVSGMPRGGFRLSGHGKDLSRYGFEDCTRIKHVMANIDS